MRAAERWVFASGNRHKLAEMQTLLAAGGIELASQRELGIAPAAETAPTFVENALLKARHAARATGLAAIADDSGLVVDALGGSPGIYSARYGGPSADDRANIAKLLAALAGVAEPERTAAFHCVLVALGAPDDPAPLIAAGCWRGRIAALARGAGGFGYDPVFIDVRTGLTAAELPPELKNRLSHRGRAARRLAAELRRRRQGR